MDYTTARCIHNDKIKLPDGSLVTIVVWELPNRSSVGIHGYKYRLNYCSAEGNTLVRYDIERRKGDHKHIGNDEQPYKFQNIDRLLEDFRSDVLEAMEKTQHDKA